MGETRLVGLEDVSLALGGQTILDRIGLAVDAGRILTIVGPNGAGKSTLLKVALGLTAAEGRIVRRPGLVVGYVPQRLIVERTLPLTVRRFLSMAAPQATEGAIRAGLDRVRAAHVPDRQIHDLSGGEMQRVLLARALLRRPDLLVLDEPVGGVDVAGQAELYDVIAHEARTEGRGVLMVSHDLHVVMAATDEVICLNRHICCAGHPEAVSRHPEYLALFGPAVAQSLAVYTHHHGPDCTHG